ncbi:hypothetical protein EHS25_007238 [Saitozyma podzolica]|uniref:Uncharacterized protein n=1 Tax=Saitozyma podzolica TaxID=1890683 RepID=A0A427XMT5_9TREE|nr:hypothetical protein EHS25_007238 [Saitozyma podzolica]
MSSSSATHSETQPRFVRSGELYFFPSFEDVYGTVNDIRTRDNTASAVYITCKLENPRSFVWVGKHDESDVVSSGSCYKLDVRGPPVFAIPRADQLGVGLQPTFTETSILEGLNSLDNHYLMPDSEASPEMTKLWENIKANQESVATRIKLMGAETTTNGQETNTNADENSTKAQSDVSETMSLAETLVG